MKVLKKVNTSNWKYVHTCTFCDSQLEVESKDVRYIYSESKSENPTYGGTEKFSAYCMVCNLPFDVPTKDMPKLLIHEIKTWCSRKSYDDR